MRYAGAECAIVLNARAEREAMDAGAERQAMDAGLSGRRWTPGLSAGDGRQG